MQEINIGDKVRFLNDIGGGTVTAFKPGNIVLVEDEDGFEVPVRQSEIVVVPDTTKAIPTTTPVQPPQPAPTTARTPSPTPSLSNKTEDPGEETLEARVLRLEMTIRKLQMRIERLEDARSLREKIKADTLQQREEQRRNKDAIVEIDLHAEELLDTTAGMSPADIKEYQLQTFRNTMQQYAKDKGRKIVFIHGNGEGVLRKAITTELRKSYPRCEYQDASFQQYGFGATMVIIH